MKKAFVCFALVCAFAVIASERPATWAAKMIGARAAVAYALVIAVGAIFCGAGINLLPFDALPQVAADGASEALAWWEHLAAVALVALVGRGLLGEDAWAAARRFVSGSAFACANAVNQIG